MQCIDHHFEGIKREIFVSIEESNDLARDVLPPGFLMVHNTCGGGKNDVAELTRGEELDDPFLEIAELDVVAWGDDTTFVQPANELDDNLAGAVVIDFLELANVAMLLHHSQELDNDL